MRYAIPILSHIFRTVLPEQFTICVTLFAVINSKSYQSFARKVKIYLDSIRSEVKYRETLTYAENSSPMNSPSLIFIAPMKSSSISGLKKFSGWGIPTPRESNSSALSKMALSSSSVMRLFWLLLEIVSSDLLCHGFLIVFSNWWGLRVIRTFFNSMPNKINLN